MSDDKENEENKDAKEPVADTPVSDNVTACLEAILIVADQPVTADQVAHAVNMTPQQAQDTLAALSLSYSQEGRGFELRETSGGWQLANRPEYETVVSAFVTDGQTARLSQAALETLAIIAYKQPVTRAQITAIRGVNSDGVIRSLTMRGLIRQEGEDQESHAALLGTSGLFLDKMGINSLSELPSLAPFLPDSFHDSSLESELSERI